MVKKTLVIVTAVTNFSLMILTITQFLKKDHINWIENNGGKVVYKPSFMDSLPQIIKEYSIISN